jgi:hypothetical protein
MPKVFAFKSIWSLGSVSPRTIMIKDSSHLIVAARIYKTYLLNLDQKAQFFNKPSRGRPVNAKRGALKKD